MILISTYQVARSEDFFKLDSTVIAVTPPVINKDYLGLDLGFAVNKKVDKWNLNYHLYVIATLFQDSSNLEDGMKAGALGFKFGGYLPFFIEYPFYLKVGTGYAKTAKGSSPIFGKDEDVKEKKDMFIGEFGLAYKIDNLFFGINYQLKSVKYFNKDILFQIGVSY